MPAFQLNDAEWDALEGLPYIARCLYLVIRRHMDFKTGITGITRKISWQSLCEELFVEPHQGRRESGTPAKERLRKVSQLLFDPGLIENFSPPPPEKLLVFKCPLATTDQSVQNKEHIKSTYQEDRQKPSNNGASREKEHSPETTKEHTPPVSGKRINTTTTTSSSYSEGGEAETCDRVCGGGDDEKKKTDAQTKQRHIPLVCALPEALIYPKQLRKPERAMAGRMVAGFGEQAQQLLDVLQVAMDNGEIRKTPLDYLHGLIRRCEAGTFDPTPGLAVAERRNPTQTQRQGLSACERAAERAIDARLREYERLRMARAP